MSLFFWVSVTEYSNFLIDFYKGKYPHQRLGQAFTNVFMPSHMDPLTEDLFQKIFYCEDNVATINLICKMVSFDRMEG